MDASLNGTLQDTPKVDMESLSEEKKEVVVEVDAAAVVVDDDEDEDDDKSLSEGDVVIKDEDATVGEENKETTESGMVEEKEEVSESEKDAQIDSIRVSDVVELELKEEEENEGEKETELPPSEENNEFSSVSGNGGKRETEVVEANVKDIAVAEEEEKNVLSSVLTDRLVKEGEESNEVSESSSSVPLIDVAPRENLETIVPTSNASEKSLEASMDKKVEKLSDVQGDSPYESAESLQPSPNVADAEVEPRSTETPTIVPVTPRQHTSWKSCCGLLEIMRGGDRL